MNPSPKLTFLYDVLWPEDATEPDKLFAVLDGARDQGIFGAVDASYQDKYCLYSGERRWPGDDLSWDIIGVAPYLVDLEQGTDLTHFVLRNGWSKDWGIFCRSDSPITSLRTHFRSLLLVRTESQRKLLFRFYDPRVLRLYLPSCTAAELRTVFGPVNSFIVPGPNPLNATEYRFDGRQLIQEEKIHPAIVSGSSTVAAAR